MVSYSIEGARASTSGSEEISGCPFINIDSQGIRQKLCRVSACLHISTTIVPPISFRSPILLQEFILLAITKNALLHLQCMILYASGSIQCPKWTLFHNLPSMLHVLIGNHTFAHKPPPKKQNIQKYFKCDPGFLLNRWTLTISPRTEMD